jgi:GDPmannose 4,6-dehydratase
MFEKVHEVPQRKTIPFYPRSPYGVTKVYRRWIKVNFRESYNLSAVSGIFFNYESPRGGTEFVSCKITPRAMRVKLGLTNDLHIGNLESRHDLALSRGLHRCYVAHDPQ